MRPAPKLSSATWRQPQPMMSRWCCPGLTRWCSRPALVRAAAPPARIPLTGRPYRRSCHRQDPARTLHATYGETIRMALDVFEKIAADGGFGDISRFFDHAETVTQRVVVSPYDGFGADARGARRVARGGRLESLDDMSRNGGASPALAAAAHGGPVCAAGARRGLQCLSCGVALAGSRPAIRFAPVPGTDRAPGEQAG
jgi:hypothetical protein